MECRLEGARSAPLPYVGVLTMPFPFIPTALGVCFFLIWGFIGGMILRDGQLTAHRERELEGSILPLGSRKPRREAA
jgi:hypothetical protein